jgi:succinate dehydrogenase hydrophobic anchor subunit
MNRFLLVRVVVVLLVLLIGGLLYVAATSTRDAPQHALDAAGGHDHDGDGKPDH